MNKKFDIIVYGATGFTGSLCVKYIKVTPTYLQAEVLFYKDSGKIICKNCIEKICSH